MPKRQCPACRKAIDLRLKGAVIWQCPKCQSKVAWDGNKHSILANAVTGKKADGGVMTWRESVEIREA